MLELLVAANTRAFEDQRGKSLFGVSLPDFLQPDSNSNNSNSSSSSTAGDALGIENENWDGVILPYCDDEEVNGGVVKCATPARRRSNVTPSRRRTDLYNGRGGGKLPLYEEAVNYFSQSCAVPASPDFNNSQLMDKSLRDIGMEKRDGSLRDVVSCVEQLPVSNVSAFRRSDSAFVVPSGPSQRRAVEAASSSAADVSRNTESAVDQFAFKVPFRPRLPDSRASKVRLPGRHSVDSVAVGAELRRFQSVENYVARHSMESLAESLESEEGASFNNGHSSGSSVPVCSTTSERSTPSPTTHDLMLASDDRCIISRVSRSTTVEVARSGAGQGDDAHGYYV